MLRRWPKTAHECVSGTSVDEGNDLSSPAQAVHPKGRRAKGALDAMLTCGHVSIATSSRLHLGVQPRVPAERTPPQGLGLFCGVWIADELRFTVKPGCNLAERIWELRSCTEDEWTSRLDSKPIDTGK